MSPARFRRPVQLSKNKIGALIAIEREIGLASTVDQGVRIDGRLSSELLNTIFWPGSALHDLGVVIQHGRISAAGCPFPLAEADGLDRSIGSRHRAALGLSQESDSVVVVVSEETGSISIAERGKLYRHIPADALLSTLKRHLASHRGVPATHLPSDSGEAGGPIESAAKSVETPSAPPVVSHRAQSRRRPRYENAASVGGDHTRPDRPDLGLRRSVRLRHLPDDGPGALLSPARA